MSNQLFIYISQFDVFFQMIIPSHTPSNMQIYSSDDQIIPYDIHPKMNFLNSNSSDKTTVHIFDTISNIKQSSISLIEQNKTSNNKIFPYTVQTECKNVLIEDFDFKNTENENIPIKRNKFHNLIFQKDSTEPIKIRTKPIMNKIYPNEFQPCFVTSENNQIQKITPDFPLNEINKLPKVATPNISLYSPSSIESDPQMSLRQKKQIQQIMMIKESFALPSDGINNKNSLNKDFKPIKPRQNFTEEQRTILNSYLQAHSNNPYAGSKDVARLVEITGLQPRQIRTYFTNKRMRDAKCMNLVTAKRCRSIT